MSSRLVKNLINLFLKASFAPLRKFCNVLKVVDCMAPGLNYKASVIESSFLALGASDTLFEMCVTWRCLDGVQLKAKLCGR